MTTDLIDAHEASMDDIASIAELLRGPEPGAVARSEEVLSALDIAESAIQREQQRLSDEQKELEADTEEHDATYIADDTLGDASSAAFNSSSD
jgi:hypothetical protein